MCISLFLCFSSLVVGLVPHCGCEYILFGVNFVCHCFCSPYCDLCAAAWVIVTVCCKYMFHKTVFLDLWPGGVNSYHWDLECF